MGRKLGDQFLDRRNSRDDVHPWPFWQLADRPISKRSAWDRIDPTFAAMSFPLAGPYQGQQQSAVPQFGLPRRLPPAVKTQAIGGLAGQAEAPENPCNSSCCVRSLGNWQGPRRCSYSRSWWKRAILRGARSWSSTIATRELSLLLRTQNWLVEEIISNAASSINVLTERDQVMPPNSGHHCSLFANYTLDGIKQFCCSP